MTLVVCAGTGTEVGKTWVGAAVLRQLRDRGVAIAARKPAQSFAPTDGGPTDAEILGAATGEDAHTVCPPHRWYPIPMAPPMAAEALGRPRFTLAELVAELGWPDPKPALRWVEAVGGVCSPLTEDADTVGLCEALHPDRVVLVADAGLGTIHAVRSALCALGALPTVVMLNRYDDTIDLHRRNLGWLGYRCGIDALTDVVKLVEALA